MLASILLLSSCIAGVPNPLPEDSPRHRFVKQLVQQSLSAPPGTQVVDIRNLKDGRAFHFMIEYADGIGTKISTAADRICISIDRQDAAKGYYVIDANLVCGKSQTCSEVWRYVDQSLASTCSASDMALFEEIVPEAGPSLENWAWDKPYAEALQGLLSGLMISFQMHEIGHMILGHETGGAVSPDELFRSEAEADGLATYVSQLVGFGDAGGSLFLLRQMAREYNWTQTANGHPPAGCRWDLSRGDLSSWYDRYAATVTKPDLSGMPPLSLGFTLPPSGIEQNVDALPSDPLCQAYARSAHAGVLKAMDLFSPNTLIEPVEHAGKLCKDF